MSQEAIHSALSVLFSEDQVVELRVAAETQQLLDDHPVGPKGGGEVRAILRNGCDSSGRS